MITATHRKTLLATVQGAGEILLRHFGKVRRVRRKGPKASVVCEADLASEEFIFGKLKAAFPDHGLIGEESGQTSGTAPLTWVADPLDGTSNFVAGLPWFGVQVGLLHNSKPVLAAMFLPIENALYVAERGKGTWRNGKRLEVTCERALANTLCAFGFDAGAGEAERRAIARSLVRVSGAVRNTRATNSLVDFCYTMDGRFGGCINLNCKIWDIVPAALMIPEAGGTFTGTDGKPIDFSAGQQNPEHTFTVLGASKRLHSALLRAFHGETGISEKL